MKQTLSVISVVVFVVLLSPSGSRADCSAECTAAIGCYGNCSITAPEGCGELCYGMCTVTCKTIGGQGCVDGGTFDCEEGDPPEWAEDIPFTGGWAVVGYWSNGDRDVYPEDLILLAGSNEDFGEYALDRMQVQLNDEVVSRRKAMAGKQGFLSVGAVAEEVFATRLYVRPGFWEKRAKVEFDFPLGGFVTDLKIEAGVFFRAVADEKGAMRSVEVLYSKYPEYNDQFVDYIREYLTAYNVESPGTPIEFYGQFGLGGPHLEPWSMILGGVEVAQ